MCRGVCVFMFMSMYTYVGVEAKGVNSLDLELQIVVSCLLWVLGLELWSSRRAATALRH